MTTDKEVKKEDFKKCDYCGEMATDLAGTPYFADVGIIKNGMCRGCWSICPNEIGEFVALKDNK